jgi:anti-sigma regulatory factor (Ser/Thr protein kinase)
VRRAEWSGEPSAEAAVRVRGQLHRLLTTWGLDDDVVEDAVLVVAELLANVVVHARTPFHLSARLEGLLLHVAVSDGRVGVPARSVNPAAGRVSGLRMVTAVAFRWGWQEHEAGKTVWAELIV